LTKIQLEISAEKKSYLTRKSASKSPKKYDTQDRHTDNKLDKMQKTLDLIMNRLVSLENNATSTRTMIPGQFSKTYEHPFETQQYSTRRERIDTSSDEDIHTIPSTQELKEKSAKARDQLFSNQKLSSSNPS
jgi:hypothetical protein